MKPTEEIIELSRKIHELGHIEPVKWGDWFFLQGGIVLCAYATKGFHEWAEAKEDVEHFKIISLDDALEWLTTENFPYNTIDLDKNSSKWRVILPMNNTLDGKVPEFIDTVWIEADTPHEAVLMAMVKVMREKPYNETIEAINCKAGEEKP